MSNKIYIGNLSFQASETELSDLLAEFGALLSVRIITDRDTGRSKGFAFAEFEEKSSMDNAIGELDGKDFLGRPLRVNEAQERPQQRRGGGGGGGRRY